MCASGRSALPCQLLSTFLEFPGGVLLASQGGPDRVDIWRTGLWWPVGVFHAATVTAALSFAPLFLLFWPFVSPDLLSSCHTFLSLSLYVFFFLFVLCTQLTPSLSHFHFVSLLPSFVILSLFLLSFFFSHTSTLPLCPLSLFASHKSIFVFFSVSSPLSLPSCCQWGHCAGEGTLRSLPATNLTRWEEVWQRTCELTRLIPQCFTVQSSRQSATKGQTLQVDVMQPLGTKTSIL